MRIILTPQRRDDALTVTKSGDTLTINGEAFDFAGLPEGAVLPREAVDCDFIASDVRRVGGVLELTLIAPHGSNPSQGEAFPAPIENAPDGVLIAFDPAPPQVAEVEEEPEDEN
ncbi:hypothetical protein [Rhizobium phage RHph_X2_26]|nr:hypothetical protein [Rhizobium phage RHph_X2_26]